MGKELYQVQGVDRLKLWLEYSNLQDKDPELQVNQCEPFSCVREFMLTLGCTRTG